jgi:hypothetical protein
MQDAVCPKCASLFICNAINIKECKCYSLNISEEIALQIKNNYGNKCLCYECLKIIINTTESKSDK